MRTTLKSLGWAVGVAAGASLCVALCRRQTSRATLRAIQILPSQHGTFPVRREPTRGQPSEFGRDSHMTCRPSGFSKLDISEASPGANNDFLPAYINLPHVRLPVPSGKRRTKFLRWTAALVLLLIALVSAYYVLGLRKRPAPPASSDFDSTRAAVAQEAKPDEHRPWVSLSQTIPQPLTFTGGGFAIKLHNSGEHPAFEVRVRDVIRIEGNSEQPESPLIDRTPALMEGTLLPGGELTVSVRFRTSAATIAALQVGRVRVVNYLLVTYEDQSHRTHATQQCFFWLVGMQSPVACESHDLAN